jgi:hypothetical protein
MSARSARFLLLLLLAVSQFVNAAEAPGAPDEGYTPPRLSHIDGQASFWRSGAEDWTPARVNMPLAPRDRFYTGRNAAIEIQIGARAFLRAADSTEFGLADIESGFLQIELKDGTMALDLRSLPAGYRVELDTPNAVFAIEQPGYYRADVDGEETHFITRRGGRATVIVEGAPSRMILASEEIIVTGTASPAVTTYAAPEPDAWDRWNYARTDYEIEALSARYVPPGVYGAGALDQYGRWRVVPDYGTVWVPDRVGPGWAPYTVGSWVWDPYFGWTWVDDAPWGWAPFHYGRWVHVGGYWAWAPGPLLVRPVYAPALVAFFGLGSGVSVRIGIGGPGVGWVALGWGEPLRPWWGRPGFRGAPWWGGWGGPRVVNNVVIERTTVVNVNTIVYQNSRVRDAVVAVDERRFGEGRIRGVRFTPREPRELEPIREAHPVNPRPASRAAASGPAIRPPPAVTSRPVVTTRPPREAARAREPEAPGVKPRIVAPAPQPRVVTPPKEPDATAAPPRPSFGERGPERQRPPQPPRATPTPERPVPAPAPRAAEPRREPAAPRVAPPTERAAPTPAPRATEPRREPAPPRVAEPPRQPVPQRAPAESRTERAPQALPGKPANVASPQRGEGARSPQARPAPSAPSRPAGGASERREERSKAAPGKAVRDR